jgi:hypothetical protein
MTNFGSRVIGKDAYDKAVRQQKGGAAVFGVRVRGSIPETGPTNTAKRTTEHGARVVMGATGSDEKGNAAEGVSIDSLKNILAENPTFFDSLFENELARSDGPRKDALKIFQQVETGIKGAGRRDVLDDIAALLGEKPVWGGAVAEANLNKARTTQIGRQIARQERNQRAKEEEVEVPATTEEQIEEIQEEQGTADAGTTPYKGVPSKPEGDVNPETQTSGERPFVPKGEAESKGDQKAEATDFDTYTIAELEKYLGDEAANVKGSGADGRVVKGDLVRAARRQERKGQSK